MFKICERDTSDALAPTYFISLLLCVYKGKDGARGNAVGWGTALQAGRSLVRFPMVSLEFFIDIILPAAL